MLQLSIFSFNQASLKEKMENRIQYCMCTTEWAIWKLMLKNKFLYFGMYVHKKNFKQHDSLKTARVTALSLWSIYITDNWYTFKHVSNTKSKGAHATECIFLETELLYLQTYSTQYLNKGTTNGKNLYWHSI